MKKNYFFINVFLLIINFVFSQDWEWFENLKNHRGLKDVGNDIVVVPNKNRIIIAGNFGDTIVYRQDTTIINSIGGIGPDGLIVMYSDKQGNVIWKKKLKSNLLNHSKLSFYSDTIYLYGKFRDKVYYGNDSIVGIYGLSNLYLIKLDTNGNFVSGSNLCWSQFIEAEDMIVNNNGIFISAYVGEIINFSDTTYTSRGIYNLLLAGYNYQLQRKWFKVGYNYDRQKNYKVSKLVFDESGNIYCTGHYKDSLKIVGYSGILNGGGEHAFILKMNTNSGNIIYLKQFPEGETTKTLIWDVKYHNKNIYVGGTLRNIWINNTDTVLVQKSKAILWKIDTSSTVQKYWIVQKGDSTIGRNLSLDQSSGIYFTIEFVDTLKFVNQLITRSGYDSANYLGIFKISADTVVRYIHTIDASIIKARMISSSCDVDEKGNFFISGSYIKSISADTNQFPVSVVRKNATSGFAGKISCKRPAPKIYGDVTICYNEQAELWTDYQSFYQPLWSNGLNKDTIQVEGGDYWLVMIDENACVSDTARISVLQYPRTNVQIHQLCDSLYVTDTFNQYQWYYGNVLSGNANYINAIQNGWYYFETVDNNGCLVRDSILIQISKDPISLKHLCDSLKIANNSFTGVWYFNGNPIDTSNSIIVHQSGDYYVHITDSVGCVISSDTVSIEIEGNRVLKIYPNPVQKDLFLMTSEENVVKKANVIDIFGRKISELSDFEFVEKTSEKCSEVSILKSQIPELKNGVYIIEIEFENGEKRTIKIEIFK
ncbi:MAG TPA: T9SS type A sorting domain-containing protein [Bacteroidia bacterium]|nr:T9SS type A sorting domain-containing protein [Bacteroidia bacterium]